MKYIDRIFGEVEINEPVILELINSPSLQRLKGIDQAGYRPLWVKPETEMGEYDHSRFAHSIGVFLLLRKYGASIEEQLAGLIHDVSHSAFSHCIDYVLSGGSESLHSYQDNIFADHLRKSEIPAILDKYGFNLEYILDDKHFPLKEHPLPDLCADRIDYSLRAAVIFSEIDEGLKNYLLENLIAEEGQWIFKDAPSAKKYAELFLRLNTIYYTGFLSAVMFRTVGDYLRYALEKDYISQNDLYMTDKIVLEKIASHHSSDEKLNELFARMNKKISCENSPEKYDAQVLCKSRVVDPCCKHQGKIMRVSEVYPEWVDIIKTESKPKEYFLKFGTNNEHLR
jgi:hypothetical protein